LIYQSVLALGKALTLNGTISRERSVAFAAYLVNPGRGAAGDAPESARAGTGLAWVDASDPEQTAHRTYRTD
jgi:hypothetical protein